MFVHTTSDSPPTDIECVSAAMMIRYFALPLALRARFAARFRFRALSFFYSIASIFSLPIRHAIIEDSLAIKISFLHELQRGDSEER